MFEDLYSNIGNKIKILAKIIAVLCTILCIATGLILASLELLTLAFLFIFAGPVLSWISSFVLYGFGTLVENSDKLANKNIKESQKISEKIKDIPLETQINIKEKKEDVFIINEDNSTSNNEYTDIDKEILSFINSTLSNTSKNTIKSIKQEFNLWHNELKSLSTAEIISKLNKPNDWQKEYIILCCIEIDKRINQSIN